MHMGALWCTARKCRVHCTAGYCTVVHYTTTNNNVRGNVNTTISVRVSNTNIRVIDFTNIRVNVTDINNTNIRVNVRVNINDNANAINNIRVNVIINDTINTIISSKNTKISVNCGLLAVLLKNK